MDACDKVYIFLPGFLKTRSPLGSVSLALFFFLFCRSKVHTMKTQRRVVLFSLALAPFPLLSLFCDFRAHRAEKYPCLAFFLISVSAVVSCVYSQPGSDSSGSILSCGICTPLATYQF